MTRLQFFVISAAIALHVAYAISQHNILISDEQPTKPKDDLIQVHLVPHTHDDVGWLKTVDQYYYGANNTIQNAGVQYILDSVIKELQADPQRKFIYVEIAFFERWWNEQNDGTKQIVRDLVSEGRLEFINGGWCMNDEATTHYTDIVDQMTVGHDFLFREFGVRPLIGWHIDPFGHSSSHPALFARMGFEGFFFGRIDYQDQYIRNLTKNLEFIWRPMKSYANTADMFTGVLYDHYSSPDGFCFECPNNQPIMDDPRLEDYNINIQANYWVQQMMTRASVSKTNHIMVLFGDDFNFQNANVMFKNMDKLMKYVNDHQSTYGINMFYSTPSLYVQAVNAIGASYTVKTDDFFPYADHPYAYWTGYFVSRAALKGYVRTRSSLLHTTDQMLTTSGLPFIGSDVSGDLANVELLAKALGVAQHHDAVAGTEKQHVADDYAKRLYIGTGAAISVVSNALSQLISNASNISPSSFSYCLYLNESYCPPIMESAWANGNVLPVVFINPLAWARTEHVRLPVPVDNVQVLDENGMEIPSQIYACEDVNSTYTLIFAVNLPPMGFNTYFISSASESRSIPPEDDFTLENDFLRVSFDPTTNRLSNIFNKINNQNLKIDQNFFWYNASAGNNVNSTQASGAYIFRPNSTATFTVTNQTIQYSVYKGDLVQEVRQIFSPWLSQTIRLFNGSSHIEVEITVDPMPINDSLGKELITRFTTDIYNAQTWYTDANGMEFQQRIYNYRPTWPVNITDLVSGNYYPVNTAAYIQDQGTNRQFTVLVDRSEGCASLANGELEIMVQRRLLYDDHRGVAEPLNETVPVRIRHFLLFDQVNSAAQHHRKMDQVLNHPIEIFFSESVPFNNWNKMLNSKFQPLMNALPENVRLETLKTLPTGEVLLRFHHLFADGEDTVLSQNATVDISQLFMNLQPVSMTEMTLTANRPLNELHRLSWNTNSSWGKSNAKTSEAKNDMKPRSNPFEINIGPMEIRTFLVRFQYI